jgi:RimJ/RimL family protein N-acetyltransferase
VNEVPFSWPAARIEGEGVALERDSLADAEDIARAVGESLDHLRPWMPWATPEAASVDFQRQRITRAQSLGDAATEHMYLIRTKPDGVLVGTCGLHRRVGPGAIEIGYWVHPAHIRKGYATAAAKEMTEAAWTLPDVDRVEKRMVWVLDRQPAC